MTVQATFAATLADEWFRAGVREVVVSPGSRSSTLTLAVLADDRLTVHVRLDERSGAFFALGCSLGSGRPVVVITTSGTATGEVHAAVMEADLAGVPLIICTADRPPELDDVGAPQTVNQRHLYGSSVRFFCAPGVPDPSMSGSWRSIASRLVAEAVAGPSGPGPVHANFAFREPLAGERDDLPPGREDGHPWHDVHRPPHAASILIEQLAEELRNTERGLIYAGAASLDASVVLGLAQALGWPVLADPRAWARTPSPGLITKTDLILRSSIARASLRPDVVVHLGTPHASRVVFEWHEATAALGTRHVLVDPFGRFNDPERIASVVFGADPGPLCAGVLAHIGNDLPRRDSSSWLDTWVIAENCIDEVLADELASAELSEPGIARTVMAALPDHAALVVAASMPIRDVEWFSDPRPGAPVVYANRGANGIDGTISTVFGVATTADRPVVGLLGDLAFLHDLSGLVFGVHETQPNATLVVIDNSGGGIFSFLPYAAALENDRFERAFGTAQTADIPVVAAALGCRVHGVNDLDQLASELARSIATPGIDVVIARTERTANTALHAHLVERSAAAIDEVLGS